MQKNMDILEVTRQIVRMNTINPPGNEADCAKYLGGILERAGFDVVFHSLGEQRLNLVAKIGGKSSKLPLGFTGHIDTVPLGAASWTTDPFSGEIGEGRLYGRGTSDMKSGVAAFVIAASRLSKKLEGSVGLEIVLTAGEETGCDGALKLVDTTGALSRVGALLVGEPTSNYPYIGHKGAFWLTATTKGVTAHGSMPEQGINAVYKAAHALCALERFTFDNPPHVLMGQATLNVGTIHGGLNINSVPDQADLEVDIRTVPSSKHTEIHSKLSKSLGKDVELKTILDLQPVYTDPQNPWVQTVYEIMGTFLKEKPKPSVATYFTDAAVLNLAYKNPPTIILGPGEPEMAHQTDEYVRIDKMESSVAVYEEIIADWCEL